MWQPNNQIILWFSKAISSWVALHEQYWEGGEDSSGTAPGNSVKGAANWT